MPTSSTPQRDWKQELILLCFVIIVIYSVATLLNAHQWVERLFAINFGSAQWQRFGIDEIPFVIVGVALFYLFLFFRQKQQWQLEIQKQKQVEEELRQQVEELKQQNADLDAFARTVAHDLKNPLSAMNNACDLLCEEGIQLPNEEKVQYAGIVKRNLHKMSSIIDELLLLARLNRANVQLQPVVMGMVVERALTQLESLRQTRQASLKLPEEWPTALGHSPWIEQIWINYISNALKYGGANPHVELGVSQENDEILRFWVRDHGPGISQEEQALLFKPFNRALKGEEDDQSIEGIGLGLSIVQHITEKLGGKVGLESNSAGTVFSFTLAAARIEESAQLAQTATIQMPKAPISKGAVTGSLVVGK